MMLAALAAFAVEAAPLPHASLPQDSLPQASLPQPAIAPKRESDCGYLSPAKGKGSAPRYASIEGFRVLGGPLKMAPPTAHGAVWAYRCTRDTIVPGPLDGRVVVLLQRPLVLVDGPRRSGVLQMENGVFVFSMRQGELKPEEKDAIQKRLDLLTANFRASVAKAGDGVGPDKVAPAKSTKITKPSKKKSEKS